MDACERRWAASGKICPWLSSGDWGPSRGPWGPASHHFLLVLVVDERKLQLLEMRGLGEKPEF